MNLIYQPSIKKGELGDCLRACVATLLGIDIDDIPVEVKNGGDDWWPSYTAFLLSHKITPATHYVHYWNVKEWDEFWSLRNDIVLRVTLGTPNSDWRHSVLYRNGNLLHDPAERIRPSADILSIKGVKPYWVEELLK